MTWLQRYRVRHYVRNSIWIMPVAAMAAAMIVVRLLHRFDEMAGWKSSFDPDTVRSVLGTLAGAMFTFIVFVCSSLLLVVQLASAQLTPRIIGIMLKDRVTKITLSTFVFTFTFALSAPLRIGSTVPFLTAEIAAFSCAASLGVFLYLIDHVGKMLRPSGALRTVASEAHQVIDNVYPRRLSEARRAGPMGADAPIQEAARQIASIRAGVILAVDIRGLAALAARTECVIELIPQVGNFVAPGSPLFRVFGGRKLPAGILHDSIALGEERTMEMQDPAFAFRIIVDIASKGLSPAINDPTTAVLAIDQIHHLLRHVGRRCLDDERMIDAQGRVRVICHTPNWEDFVALAVTEIRHFGGTSIQVARRLRAMIEDLIHVLPADRAEPLRQELKLVHRSAERFFLEPEDRELAEFSDSQGVGGKRGPRSLRGEPGPAKMETPP